MRATDLHKLLAHHTGYPVREIDQRTRWIHQRGLVRPGRGRSAPHLTTGALVPMILSLCARRAVDAERVALRLFLLLPAPNPDALSIFTYAPPPQCEPVVFGTALGTSLVDPSEIERHRIKGLELSEDGRFASISLTFGGRILYIDRVNPQDLERHTKRAEKLATGGIDRRLHIGADVLTDIAKRHSEDWRNSYGRAPDWRAPDWSEVAE